MCSVVGFCDDDESIRLERDAYPATVRPIVVREENRQVLEWGIPPGGLASFDLFLPPARIA